MYTLTDKTLYTVKYSKRLMDEHPINWKMVAKMAGRRERSTVLTMNLSLGYVFLSTDMRGSSPGSGPETDQHQRIQTD